MNKIYKYIFSLLLVNLFLALTAFIVISLTEAGLRFADVLLLQAGFSFISVITVLIFLRGQTKEPGSQTMHTLTSIGLKFILELFLAMACFVIFKKKGVPYVILFFVLYLCLTLFSVFYMLKTLKSKPL